METAEKRMEKQIGCISGFFQIFDRQQILAEKRIHSTKRLPPSTVVGASPETVTSVHSPESSGELPKNMVVMPESYRKPTPSFPTSETKDDTAVVADGGDDKRRRSPSVIARLMGLEALSSSPQPALRRSASESRDLSFHSKYIDGNNFQVKQPKQAVVRDEGRNTSNGESVNLKSEASRTFPWKSTSFFNSEDIFPEPMHGDLEKMRGGMDEQQSNDLGTLKQILEVLQLKGLLHSTRPSNRNFVYVRNLPSDGSSIVLMKPWGSPASNQRSGGGVDRSGRSPARARNSSATRIESNLKSCNSIIKRKPLSIEIQTRANESSSDSLTKLTPKRTGSNRSPRNQKPPESSSSAIKQKIFKNVVTENESCSATVCTPSPTATEGNRHGRSLLQRCDKLLHNIAEMNQNTESPPSSTTVLPSPVSVLDSGFDKDESSSPSHSIDSKVSPPAIDYEDESCSPSISHEEFISDDSDFLYISEILRISPYLHEDRTLFFSLVEKQLCKSNETCSNVSKRQRKLVFDVIVEILDRKKADSRSLKQIWSEFQKIREINTGVGDGMMESISGVLRKDLIEIKGWIDHPMETSEAVLDIERMIFKDLVNEAIGDLAEFPAKCVFSRAQRKLVF